MFNYHPFGNFVSLIGLWTSKSGDLNLKWYQAWQLIIRGQTDLEWCWLVTRARYVLEPVITGLTLCTVANGFSNLTLVH